MRDNLSDIIRKIEDTRAFSESNYLKTTHLVIFLLFGGSEEQVAYLVRKAHEIVAVRASCAFVDVSGAGGAAVGAWDIIDEAAREQVKVDDLNNVHLCPIIFSGNADSATFVATINEAEQYLSNRDIRVELKPFLILDTSLDSAGTWLGAVADGIVRPGGTSCRCCVLTLKDEKGFAVSQERLLSTVLLIAFLNVVSETRDDIGRRISYRAEAPDELFYTAQTAFVTNPVVIRTFNRMRMLLELFGRFGDEVEAIDMSFMQDILRPCFERLPRENGAISLLPLYAVVPNPDGDTRELARRLSDFVNRYYLGFLRSAPVKQKLLEQIGVEFLKASVRADWTIDRLAALVGNGEELEKLSRVQAQGVRIAPLPEYPRGGRIAQAEANVYADCAERLRAALLRVGKGLLDEYFNSDMFSSLPRRFADAQRTLKLEDEAMERIVDKRGMTEFDVKLLNDPDEEWISGFRDAVPKEVYIKAFSAIALSGSEDEASGAISDLIEKLYEASKTSPGGNDAKKYMRLVSESCADVNSPIAKECVRDIAAKLLFPVRLQGNVRAEESCAYVWGNQGNYLYRALKEHEALTNMNTQFLGLNTDERFVILRVSAAFKRGDILNVARGE
ncbi:MAG: hypothetical protein LBC21_00880 [Oscillospiraceae bacterium]|jgi:hypothetical protein|nr:hypothetical protein [Oscillospiraceae bacterium]